MNNTKATIRKATIADVSRLVRMRWEHINIYNEYKRRPTVSYEQFEQSCSLFLHEGITSGRWVVFVAVINEVIVGHSYVQVIEKIPKPYSLEGAWGYVSNMYIEEPYRNHGIGTMLIDVLKAWAHEEKFELLLLWPSEKSTNFYARNGFSAETKCMQYTIKED